jgi:alpha-amylase/alpha-mannosidase (GH57 family)
MALAAAIAQVEAEGFAVLTNYGAFLAKQPPAFEVQIRELTSWSCVHGVERWRSDCGCKTRPDWHQRWRGPLRDALDWLRDQIDAFYESRASAFLKNPWEARDAYIDVMLDRSPDGLATWLPVIEVLLDQAEVELQFEMSAIGSSATSAGGSSTTSALEPCRSKKPWQ